MSRSQRRGNTGTPTKNIKDFRRASDIGNSFDAVVALAF